MDVTRKFKFRHSPLEYNGVPIIAANMDTTGTFEVYNCLSKHNIITSLHKFYKPSDFVGKNLDPNLFMVSTGISDIDFENLCHILHLFSFKTPIFERTNEDVIISINELNVKYEQHINELKIQIEKLTYLVYELQKINIRVDDKTTEITNEIQQIIENT